MGMSAQLIGRGLGLTAREFNALLLEHGYLQGSPGNYSLTDKGLGFGSEHDHFRGNPGSSVYSAQWSTRTWDDRIASALAADIAAAADRPSAAATAEPAGVEQDSAVDQNEDDHRRSPWVVAAVVGGSVIALAGGVVAATNPHVHRWAREKIQPRTTKAWRTLTRQHDDDVPAPDEVPADAPAHHAIPMPGPRTNPDGEHRP